MRKCSTFVLASFEHAKIDMRKHKPLSGPCVGHVVLSRHGANKTNCPTVLNAAQFVLFVKPHIFQQKKEVGFYNYQTPHSLKASNIIKCVTHQTSPYIQNCTPRALTCFFPESCLKKQVHPMFPKKTRNHILVLGFDPFEKYLSKWDPRDSWRL